MRKNIFTLLMLAFFATGQFDQGQLFAEIKEKESNILMGCKSPKQGPAGVQGSLGPTGPTGPSGPPFVVTFGTFNVPGAPEVFILNGDIIPFSVDEASSGVTNAAGDFTLTKSGVYQVIFGVVTLEPFDIFDIELSGTLVSGGRINPLANGSLNTITAMFTAAAGEHLVVRNKSNGGQTASLGTGDVLSVSAYISIVQIQ